MNRVDLIGRLTKDIELKKTNNNTSVIEFNLAINNMKGEADFVRCIAWRQSAEFLNQYAKKGNRIGIEGRIQTRTYDSQDGSKKYITEVVAERVELLESRKDNQEGNVPMYDDYESNTPKLNGKDIDNLPFY